MLRRNRDFVHFAATSPGIPFEKRFLRRPSRSSFPFFSVGHLPRRAFLLLSLSLCSLTSSPSARFSRFFNVVALSPSCFSFADLDATRLDPREKRRNESGTPLELLMLPPLTLSRDSSPPSLVKPPNIGR